MSQSPDLQVPRHVLIVDDDAAVLEQLHAQLSAASYEVKRASDGEEALTLAGRQWFPVVVTDWTMPVIDGLQFTQRLRACAVAPTYVIMLTASSSNTDYEKGYCAGVDHYLAKKMAGPVLVNRVQLGFHTIALRKSPRSRIPHDQVITVDLESGAHTPRHVVGRLQAEMQRSIRVQQQLTVVCIGIEQNVERDPAQNPKIVSPEQFGAVLAAVGGAIRPNKDWVVRLPGGRCAHRLAIISPEAGAAEAAAIEQRIRNAFVIASDHAASLSRPAKLSFGVAAFPAKTAEDSKTPVTALDLLGTAERHRQGIATQPNALDTVQGSGDSEANAAGSKKTDTAASS
jgi:DNA-binding response OmpR family regulator